MNDDNNKIIIIIITIRIRIIITIRKIKYQTEKLDSSGRQQSNTQRNSMISGFQNVTQTINLSAN